MTATAVFPFTQNGLSTSERLTLWTLRRLSGPPQPTCRPRSSLSIPCFRQDFEAVAAAFHRATHRLARHGVQLSGICMPGTEDMTPLEQRLLAATSAAQSDEHSGAWSILRPIFPHHAILGPIVTAITLLGACLAGAGYWLPHGHKGGGDARQQSLQRFRWERSPDTARRIDMTRIEDATPGDAERRSPSFIGGAALGTLSRWHDLDMAATPILWARPDASGRSSSAL